MGYPQDEAGDALGARDYRHGRLLSEVSSVRSDAAWLGASLVGSGVMALDTGNVPDEYKAHPDWKDPVPPITAAATLGAGLRAARLAGNRSLAELSTATRVHVRYLTALEENDWSVLPTRVFSIGYVRAYAGALGIDEQLAVERFKREVPDPSVPLQAPVGVAFEEVRRYSPRVIGAIVLVGLAVLGWNVFQRVNLFRAAPPSEIAEVPESWSLGAVPGQVIGVGLPRPAPADQTVPDVYVTPGLEDQLAGVVPLEAAAAASTGPVARAFNPRGAVYGAEAAASDVTLQARRPSYVIVRMGDQRVLFARQMAAGEAWRAPRNVQATVEVADPAAFDVYMFGEHAGGLAAAQTPLSQLNARATAQAREAAAAEETARRAAAERAAAVRPPVAQPVTPPVVAAAPSAGAAPAPAPVPVTPIP